MYIAICGTHYIAVWFLLEIGWLPEALAHVVLMVLALQPRPASPQICLHLYFGESIPCAPIDHASSREARRAR
jgi:hypothetical protein